MRACPRCQTRTGGGASLCRNCGGPLPPIGPEVAAPGPVVAWVPPSVGIRACAQCGGCVPARAPHCARCGATAEVRVVPPRPDGAYWARVVLEYSCAACKAYWPLAAFDAEGRAVGAICGHVQDFPIFFWRVVLAHAHAVADLAGPDPEGRGGAPGASGESVAAENPFKDVGLSTSSAEGDAMRDDADVPRGLRAGPGVPVCPSCLASIDPDFVGGELVCGCGWRAQGVLAKTASKVNRGLVTVLGAPLGPSRGGARPGAEGPTLVALRCPTCSGPVTLDAGASLASCSFCKTTSIVARPAPVPAAKPDAPTAELACWFLFRGPSAKRKSLLERPR